VTIGASKVSKQLRDLLECKNGLRLWVISFSFFNYDFFGMRCLLGFRNLIKFKRSSTLYTIEYLHENALNLEFQPVNMPSILKKCHCDNRMV